MTMQNEPERKTSRGLVKIINPENIINMDKYCQEKEFTVQECYGYYRTYCPRTCSYAKGMDKKR